MSAPASHTPGPWALIHFGGPQIGNPHTGEAVCTMWGSQTDPTDAFAANARLIAAAPDLLAALESALAVIDAVGIFWMGEANARTAAAKARGLMLPIALDNEAVALVGEAS